MRDELEAKLENLPPAPGCYLFKDKKAEVLYVGNAKSLRALNQYWASPEMELGVLQVTLSTPSLLSVSFGPQSLGAPKRR